MIAKTKHSNPDIYKQHVTGAIPTAASNPKTEVISKIRENRPGGRNDVPKQSVPEDFVDALIDKYNDMVEKRREDWAHIMDLKHKLRLSVNNDLDDICVMERRDHDALLEELVSSRKAVESLQRDIFAMEESLEETREMAAVYHDAYYALLEYVRTEW